MCNFNVNYFINSVCSHQGRRKQNVIGGTSHARGVGGHAPPDFFLFLGVKSCILGYFDQEKGCYYSNTITFFCQ